ncbi:MAG: hypothetical protein JWM43_1817 [Acidobacteriaceae bacterium]|nr:hypothetical protein [Acidobacteriaceae bacterium]
MAKMSKVGPVEASSGNVFADLGLANAEELGTKLRLSVVLNGIMAERGLSQVEAAEALGVNQPKISALQHYKLEGFSVERLMHFVTALKHDVVIEIRPRAVARGMGRISIVRAGTVRRGAVAVARRKRVGVAALA